ncbi:DEAD/DEAH box helicase [Gulosibacter massiliensis]|uniref:helicase-related protein n=1 Tax=Gulosibacter massiliensis TaxID=2479839 RepID=UPI000F639C2E|nr:DEAD/DEAH box helicase [Gulosibacter massiliensis]
MTYADLIARRARRQQHLGRIVDPESLRPSLAEFQRHIVTWACEVGNPAIWADTGLGKTRMQIEWCRLMGDTTLIVTPLAVAEQTVEEAEKIGVTARYIRSHAEVTGPGVYVTNIEMVDAVGANFDAVALDEASILKQSDGKTRTKLIETFAGVPYRSTWTATPAPNDPEELTNQAEFLGHSTRTNMLAAYFVHDQDGWRLKGHAWNAMITWMQSWAIAVRRPSDLGFDDTGYILPGLNVVPEIVPVDVEPAGDELFTVTVGGVGARARIRKETLDARVNRVVELVEAEPDEPWLLWCGLNDEANELAARIPGAVNVHGSMTPEEKASALLGFAHGDIQVLITKPKIAGMGLNFQRCARMAFVGINDSYEQYYQAIRRCYRYGQQRVVNAHVVVSELESQIADNVARKEHQANRIVEGMVTASRRAA